MAGVRATRAWLPITQVEKDLVADRFDHFQSGVDRGISAGVEQPQILGTHAEYQLAIHPAFQ